ncbi:SDR family oxidoreductase [Pseudonocardia lacus]|uniref:SDR family oxidoreductase n=1 Tax=Pseudonocardia lacus TaxID=2835865 RepID=UPI001BDD98E5|nr:NAD(P)H-binding protein [Pseudonocardia lacus]
MIVVTGATGNVGRPLVDALAAAGERVTAVSRHPAPVPAGVRHRRADLADPDALRPLLDGADALYVLVSGAGAHVDGDALLDAAKAGGVRRVVLQSSQAVGTRPGAPSHAPLAALEDALRGSDLEWTVLRPGGFASNAFAWAESVRARRAVVAPFGDVALPVVDPLDIAAVAAAVLRGTGHGGRVYELTGPEPIDPRGQAAAVGAAIGEPVEFVEQPPDEARALMLGFMPAPVAEGTLAILGAPTPAERRVSPDVEDVLGRPGLPFARWAARNAAAFR